jgi:hypothetical protein
MMALFNKSRNMFLDIVKKAMYVQIFQHYLMRETVQTSRLFVFHFLEIILKYYFLRVDTWQIECG